MKTIVPLLSLIIVLLASAGCANQDYNTDLLDKEITLFEREISVPVGDIGPFTLELALKSKTIGSLLGSVLQTEEDGTIIGKKTEVFYKINAYEIVAKTKDLSQPFTYSVGDQDLSPAAMSVSLLSGFGFSPVDQHVSITVNNPLKESYTLGDSSFVRCVKSGDPTFEKYVALKEITIPSGYGTTTLLETDIPETARAVPNRMGVKNLSFNLPADLMDKISSSNAEFTFTSNYTGHIAAGENLNLDLASLGLGSISAKAKLPIGPYRLKDVQVSFDLENTFPLDVTLSSLQLMTGEEPAVDTNLEVSPGTLVIGGGSPQKPTVTPITLRIKALSGAIPDITGIQVGLKLSSASGYATTPLSVKQGISVKSASATLRGGITFGNHE